MNSVIIAKTAESDSTITVQSVIADPYEFPGDRRARILKEFWIRSFNRWLDLLVRFIYWLAAKRIARAEAKAARIAASRVISEATKCRGCGWKGKLNRRGEILIASVYVEFEYIQPQGQEIGAIKLTCRRCKAFWFEPTVQPSKEWVVPKQHIKAR